MKIKVEYIPKTDLKAYAGNAKLHPAEQIEQIKSSIEQFGFNDPIAVWKDNEIIEGHGRFMAVMEMDDIDTVPIIRLDDMTDEQRRAYMLVHNKLTMNTDFDFELLELELDSIDDIDMSEFGFEFNDVTGGEVLTDDAGSNFNYTEQYGVIVMCDGEAEQEKVYNRLTEEGFKCKVVAV